ncbi:MAG TPA: homoserine kinase [Vicinamibacterales bacterium]
MSISADRLAALTRTPVRVPGSTSNLGPGFDALGLALQLYLEVSVTAVEDDRRGELQFDFEGGVPPGENAIEQAIRSYAAQRGLTLPSLRLSVRNEIPVQAGLGSSAAAIVAGLRIVERLAPVRRADELLEAATALEGHPDNVSASLLGGLTASAQIGDRVTSVAAPWPAAIRVVVATPRLGLATKAARAVLPREVPQADAIHNVQRTALLLQAIHTGRVDAVRDALADRLHQPYRAPLVPGLAEALAFEHPSLLGAFLSGAGPSIAAFAIGDPAPVAALFDDLYRVRLGLACDVRTLDVHQPDPLPPARDRAPLPEPASGVPS